MFKFENAHIVRGCSTKRCKENIHGHSYKVEVLLESNFLDRGQMVYDFGLMKRYIKECVESFDHAITLWSKDNKSYLEAMKLHSKRWIELPVSPSAEQFSRVFFLLIERVLELMEFHNSEKEVRLYSVIVHETDTGYAQCFKADAHSALMGKIDLDKISFSEVLRGEWSDEEFFEKLLSGKALAMPQEI